jgi:hypothetical protein
MNLVFLISDAPTHGKQYNNFADVRDDEELEKTPEGSLEAVLKEYK